METGSVHLFLTANVMKSTLLSGTVPFFVATTGGSEMFIFYTAFFTTWIKNLVAFSFTQTSSVSIQCFSTELAISHLETVIKAALSS